MGGEGGKEGLRGKRIVQEAYQFNCYIFFYILGQGVKAMPYSTKSQGLQKPHKNNKPDSFDIGKPTSDPHRISAQSSHSNVSGQRQINPAKVSKSVRNKAVLWSQIEQLYYFDAVVRFVTENPYLRVSWTQWKPSQYFYFIAEQMAQLCGKQARNATQIKTKDQQLKKHYYSLPTHKIDILVLALRKLTFFVNQIKQFSLPFGIPNTQLGKAYLRCDQTLRSYKELLAEMTKLKTYEIQLANLVSFIQQPSTENDQLSKINDVKEQSVSGNTASFTEIG